MSERDKLAAPDPADVARVAEGSIYRRAEITHTVMQTQTFELGPEASRTRREVARQETWRTLVVGVCVLAAIYVIRGDPKTGWPLASLLMVFSGVVSLPKIIEKLKQSKGLDE
jgi:hypothetical protein